MHLLEQRAAAKQLGAAAAANTAGGRWASLYYIYIDLLNTIFYISLPAQTARRCKTAGGSSSEYRRGKVRLSLYRSTYTCPE